MGQSLAGSCVSEMVLELAAIDPLADEAARCSAVNPAGRTNGGGGVIKQSRMSDE